jgi:hypothetical protein
MRIKLTYTKASIFLIFTFSILAACADSPLNPNQSNFQVDSEVIPTVNTSTDQEQSSGNQANAPQENYPDNGNKDLIPGRLQGLNLDTNQFRVVSSDQVEWEDTCLGIEQPGAECVSEVTPGYLVVLEADGLQFKYHADQKGSRVQPATPALLWTRDGGEQGYCDKLIIYLPDTIHVCWCQNGELESTSAVLQEVLSIEEYEQFINALKELSKTIVNQPSSGQTEPEMVSLTFYGQGNNQPDKQQQETLLSLANIIFARISPQ